MSRTLHLSGRTVPGQSRRVSGAVITLDVNFILGGKSKDASPRKQSDCCPCPKRRITPALVAHSPLSRYSVAVWLAKKYQPHKGKALPDYFSKQLNLHPTADPEENLRALAKRHKELSSARVNWLGTYQHAPGSQLLWNWGRRFDTAGKSTPND